MSASTGPLRPIVIGVSSDASCAVVASGELVCWGSLGFAGGDQGRLARPVRIDGVRDLVDLSMSMGELCVVDRVGALRCATLIGSRRTDSIDTFARPIEGIPQVRSVVVADVGGCAIDVSGAVHCWGRGGGIPPRDPPCAPNDEVCSRAPRQVQGVENARSLAVRFGRACAVLESGQAACWGNLDARAFGGDEGPRNAAFVIPDLDDARSIAVDLHYVCVARANGEVSCWAFSPYGVDPANPMHRSTVSALAGATEVHAFDEALCGRTDGIGYRCVEPPPKPPRPPTRGTVPRIYADSAALSYATEAYRELAWTEYPGATSLARGDAHGCLRDATGAVRCWGDNAQGALGDPYSMEARTPILVLGADGSVITDEVRRQDPAYGVFPDVPSSAHADAIQLDLGVLSLRGLGATPTNPLPWEAGTLVRANLEAHADEIRGCLEAPPAQAFAVELYFAHGLRGLMDSRANLPEGPERTCLEAVLRRVAPPRSGQGVTIHARIEP